MLRDDYSKIGFIRGFLNAEAGLNKTITVQQSVRINLSSDKIKELILGKTPYDMAGRECYFIPWSVAKKIIPSNEIKYPNLLNGLNKLLSEFGIQSRVYPIRLYIGKKIGIHFELSISQKHLNKIKSFNMLSCNKKVDKLNKILRG